MEIELKWGLTDPLNLERLLAHLPGVQGILTQENHYFTDVRGRLRQAKTMVRLREEVSSGFAKGDQLRALLTIKRRVAKDAGVFRAEEIEERIDIGLWRDIQRGLKSLDDLDFPALHELKATFDVDVWQQQGTLMNRRHVVLVEGFVLEIDQTTFDDGHVDVEVEVETEDIEGAKALLTRVGHASSIDFFEQTQGKYSRFLKRHLAA